MLVVFDDTHAGFFLYGNWRDLLFERAVLNRVAGTRQRLHRVFVLIFSTELISLGRGLAEIAHRAAGFVSIFKAVHQHVIDDAIMADAITATSFLKQVGRIGHALHTARDDDIGGARVDDVVRQHGGLHAGTAHLVDRGCTGGVRQLGAARSLARRGLALSGGKNTAHEDFVDSLGRQLCPLESGADGMRTEIMRAERRKLALKAAKGSANCGYDDDWIG